MIPSAVSCGSSPSVSPSASTARSRRSAIQLDPARDPAQQPEQEVRVGHGRLLAAVTVGGRTGTRARRAWADAQRAARVPPGDRAAAGADGVDVEHRQRDRPAADLAPAGLAHLAAEHHADVAARAAHVEAQRVRLARGVRGPGGAGGAARGAGEHGQHRVVGGLLQARRARRWTASPQAPAARRPCARCVRLRRYAASSGERAASSSVVAARSYSRNVPTTSWLRETCMSLLGERLPELPLVLGVAVRVQEADGDRLGLERHDRVDGRPTSAPSPARPASFARRPPTRRSGGTSGAGRAAQSR